MSNFSHITSPLSKFEIRDLLSLDAPLLGNLHISLTNIGLYLTIGAFSLLTLIFLATNYNKVSNSWSISLTAHGLIIPITIVGKDIINSGVISDPIFIYYMGISFYTTCLGTVLFISYNFDKIYLISFKILDISFDIIKDNPFLFIRILLSFIVSISFAHPSHDGLLVSSLSPENMCNEQDVDPVHENRLNVVYQKLARLATGGDNNRLSMNSVHLRNGLTFTPEDRATMHRQISNAYPNMMFRFNNTNNPTAFSFPNSMSSEILELFRPSNP